MRRKFTAIPGKGIFAGSAAAIRRRIVAAEEYDGKQFDEYQMREIRKGLDAGVDVSVYADPKYDNWQMHEIRLGLEDGVDVSIYADPEYGNLEMQRIREGLESDLDVSIYADPEFSYWEMGWIQQGLEDGVDVSIYADPKYDSNQMEQIYKGLKRGLDVSQYADPKYSGDEMKAIRQQLSGYSKPKATTALKTKIREAVNNNQNDSKFGYMTMLNNNVIEIATPDLDMYQYKELSAVVQAAYDNELDLNNSDEIIEAIYDAEPFESASTEGWLGVEDMLETVKKMRKKYRGTDEPIYMKNEYALNES